MINWRLTIFLFLVIFVAVILAFFLFLKDNDNCSYLLTLVGTYVSIFALVVTLIQVRNLEKTAVTVKAAADSAKEAAEKVMDISSIAIYISYLRFVKECLTNEKYELARIRLQDIKDFLPRVRHISGLAYSDNEFRSVITGIEEILTSLDDEINNVNRVDISSITRNIEKVATFLDTIENQLKA